MNISLTPQLEQYINEKVKTGLFSSSSEVVRQALRLLIAIDNQEIEKLKTLQNAINEGVNSGEATPLIFKELRNAVTSKKK